MFPVDGFLIKINYRKREFSLSDGLYDPCVHKVSNNVNISANCCMLLLFYFVSHSLSDFYAL